MCEVNIPQVVAKFIGDDEVVENIVCISQKTRKEQKLKKQILSPSKVVCEELIEEEEEIPYKKPTELQEDADGIKGKDIFPLSRNSRSKKQKKSVKKKQSLSVESDSNDDSNGKISSEDGNVSRTQNAKVNFSEDFFTHHKKNETFHNHSKMKNFKFTMDAWQDQVLKIPDKHIKEINSLHQQYKLLFGKWKFLLSEGFNVLLYGLGSKIQILHDFCKELEDNSVTLIVNGFFPSLTIKHILNTVMEQVIKQDKSFRNPSDQANFIKENIGGKDLYIIINNIEANLLGSEKSQAVLSSLAVSKNIHIVASIDHINAPLVWDQAKLSMFKWAWFDSTSFSSYTAELSYENSLLTRKQGKMILSSVLHVFNSLTPNAQGIFLILARYHHEQKDKNYSGIPFQELYQECREAFLVNSDLTLRAQLTEFRDHKLLRLQKSSDGVELVQLLIDTNSLSEFLELQDEK